MAGELMPVQCGGLQDPLLWWEEEDGLPCRLLDLSRERRVTPSEEALFWLAITGRLRFSGRPGTIKRIQQRGGQ
jgi:hypothetical protein